MTAPLTKKKFYHWAFEIGIFLKGLNGLLEIIAGILLLLVPNAINQTLNSLVHMEFTPEQDHFLEIFLFGHGIVKVGLFITLFKKKLWAYPTAMVLMAGLVGYQSLRLLDHYSILLAMLTCGDVFIIFFIWQELLSLRKARQLERPH